MLIRKLVNGTLMNIADTPTNACNFPVKLATHLRPANAPHYCHRNDFSTLYWFEMKWRNIYCGKLHAGRSIGSNTVWDIFRRSQVKVDKRKS
jgi:hypothetical protein